MLISKKTVSKKVKLLSLVAIVLFIFAGGYLVTARYKHLWPFEASSVNTPTEAIDYSPPTQEQKDLGQETKDALTGNSKNQTVDQPLPDQTTGKTAVTVTITSASVSDDVLSIRTSIGTVTSEGTCRLSMKGPAGNVFSGEAAVQPLASSTTCKGFNVPVSSLATGTWEVTVVFENSSHTGTATKLVEVK